ncbi:uncharacterized protein LOC121834058, partial [Ixodes scapularis]|uniref:uncharacterized protein LOC121834058 n=1 Tax=Ixodes scapularis TaxID=6945 RepID=UPI001C38FFA3
MALGGRISEFDVHGNSTWEEYVERIELYCAVNKVLEAVDKRAVLLSAASSSLWPGDVLLFEAAEYPPVTAAEVAGCTSQDSRLSEVRKWIIDGWPKEGVPEDYGAYEIRQNELSQHSTPHSESGKNPAELMLGGSLRSGLSKLHPDAMDVECKRQPPEQSFQCGDSVYARNFRQGPKWLAARVLRRRGHVMYEVQTSDGSIHRRHRNHVRRAWE